MTRDTSTDNVVSDSTDGTATIDPGDAGRRRAKSVKLFLRDILIIFVAALVISFLIKTLLIRSFYIPSASMMDTLLKDDRIIVSLLTPRVVPIDHGDVIVFQDPGGWLDPAPEIAKNPIAEAIDNALGFVGLSAADSEDHLIKRVIGLPGDVVVCCDDFGQITVNGVPIEESYIKLPDGVSKATEHDFTVTVPTDSYWVMGDNRYNSSDSSYHHFEAPGHEYVPVDKVVGRAILITWPANRWTWLDNYPIVFRGVDSAGDK